jgi:hypothetical protein
LDFFAALGFTALDFAAFRTISGAIRTLHVDGVHLGEVLIAGQT